MNREVRGSQRSARGLARRRLQPVNVLRWLLVFSFVLTGLSGLIPAPGPFAAETAEAHHSSIKLPVPAGESWSVSQGYNTNPAAGGSHYNCNAQTLRDDPSGTRSCSQYWQYKYSFDLVPSDGSSAAGRTVLSPVNGVIRWVDEAYGGMSINLEDGYAYAYFHTNLAPGLAAGQRVTQGQYLGTVAPSGQAGNGGFPHLHVTLWQTNDGGNWDRNPVAFSGSQAIEGVSLAAQTESAVNQHRGAAFTSSNVVLANDQNPPSPPVHLAPGHGVTYDATSQVVTLSWSASTGATEYRVWINDSPASGWISTTSWTTPTLTTGQYAWQVKARGAGGEGSLSGKWVFWVDPAGGDDLPPLSTTPGPLGLTNAPSSGTAGTSVVVTGAGMTANETVDVFWDSTSGTRIGQTTANSAGNWRITFTVPDATGGSHQVVARGVTSNRNTTGAFSVSSSIQRVPISGVPGTSIEVTVKGFAAGELVSLIFHHSSSSTHALGSVRVNANGTGVTTVTMPSSTTGQHDYRGVGQASGRTAWGALWVQPSMTLSKDQGASGDSVTATVRGFPSSTMVRVAWNQSGSSSGTTLCNSTTSSTGSITCTFNVPSAAAGAYPIVATAGSTTISATFGIGGTAALTVTPTSGNVASPFQLSLGGFLGNESVRLSIDGASTPWRTVSVASNGTALVKSTIPYLTQGNHTITARGVTSGRSVSGTLTISPSMDVNPSGGAAGSTASAWMR
ncbi:MAG: M23 family metallopeptidase, partial [Thermomicrobiales bacterium]|nr:M23 family metallopeptidase [Thermomicrobiales bacterium]